MEVDDAAGRVRAGDSTPARGATSTINPEYRAAILEGLHDAAQAPGGTSYGVFGGFPIPVAGKTGTAQRPAQRRPVLVRRARALPEPEDRHRRDDRAKAASAPTRPRRRRSQILSAYFGKHTHRAGRPQRGQPGLMYATRAARSRPEPFTTRPSIAERLGLPYIDGPMALAAIALVAFSIFTLAQATLDDVPGDPYYYVERQAIYAGLGILGMVLLTRIDYSRFRELRVGIYTFLCVSVSLVFVFGFAARGSRRAFDLPFFSFQPSELGKLLLVLALAGFVIDGARRGSEVQRTVRYLCLGLAPAALVFLQPDLGTSLVFGVDHPRRDVLRGRPLDALRGHRRRPRRYRHCRTRGRPDDRDAGAEGLPGGKAYVFPASQRGPKRRGLPAEPGQDRHRLRSEDRPRRSRPPRRGSTSCPSGTPTSSSR